LRPWYEPGQKINILLGVTVKDGDLYRRYMNLAANVTRSGKRLLLDIAKLVKRDAAGG
jgi:hypothetical protein